MGEVSNIHVADSYKYILSNLKYVRIFRASFKKMYSKREKWDTTYYKKKIEKEKRRKS